MVRHTYLDIFTIFNIHFALCLFTHESSDCLFVVMCVGSIAAGIQAGIGNVVAGSAFATLTSAGMGGYGAAVVAGAAQAAGGAAAAVGAAGAYMSKKGKGPGDDDNGEDNNGRDGGNDGDEETVVGEDEGKADEANLG